LYINVRSRRSYRSYQTEYSEISFFKKIRRVLSISDEKILEAMPDKEEYILPDIEDDFDDDWNVTFDKIQVVPISQLNI
jgi:hypothetical protein